MFSIGRDVSFSIKERLDFPGVKTFSFIWGEFINLFWDLFSFIQGIFINRRWTLSAHQHLHKTHHQTCMARWQYCLAAGGRPMPAWSVFPNLASCMCVRGNIAK